MVDDCKCGSKSKNEQNMEIIVRSTKGVKEARRGKGCWRHQKLSLPGLHAPFLDSFKAVPDDDHLGQCSCGPVPPEEVVVQGFPAVHHVKQRGRSLNAMFPLLRGNQRLPLPSGTGGRTVSPSSDPGAVWPREPLSSGNGSPAPRSPLTSLSGSSRSPSSASVAASWAENAGSNTEHRLGGTCGERGSRGAGAGSPLPGSPSPGSPPFSPPAPPAAAAERPTGAVRRGSS